MDHRVRYAGRLSQQTFRTFLQFLRDTAVLHGHVSFARLMVSRLPTLLPLDLTAYHELTPTTFRTIWTGAPAYGGATSAVHMLEQYPDHQPCAARHSEGEDERLLDFADFLSWRQFSTLKIYQDFYRLMGIRYQVMLGLPPPRRASSPGLWSAASSGPFLPTTGFSSGCSVPS